MSAADPRDWMWAEACAMLERAEHLHRRFFQPGPSAVPCWQPPVDVLESERELTIMTALPGVEPAEIKVALEGDQLVVTGVRRLPAAARGMAIHRLEIPYGRFERRIALPAGRWELARSSIGNGCLLLALTRRF